MSEQKIEMEIENYLKEKRRARNLELAARLAVERTGEEMLRAFYGLKGLNVRGGSPVHALENV